MLSEKAGHQIQSVPVICMCACAWGGENIGIILQGWKKDP